MAGHTSLSDLFLLIYQRVTSLGKRLLGSRSDFTGAAARFEVVVDPISEVVAECIPLSWVMGYSRR
jgi:hypothetical protein